MRTRTTWKCLDCKTTWEPTGTVTGCPNCHSHRVMMIG